MPRALGWTVETLNQGVDAESLSLPADLRVSSARIVERVQALGLEPAREPHGISPETHD